MRGILFQCKDFPHVPGKVLFLTFLVFWQHQTLDHAKCSKWSTRCFKRITKTRFVPSHAQWRGSGWPDARCEMARSTRWNTAAFQPGSCHCMFNLFLFLVSELQILMLFISFSLAFDSLTVLSPEDFVVNKSCKHERNVSASYLRNGESRLSGSGTQRLFLCWGDSHCDGDENDEQRNNAFVPEHASGAENPESRVKLKSIKLQTYPCFRWLVRSRSLGSRKVRVKLAKQWSWTALLVQLVCFVIWHFLLCDVQEHSVIETKTFFVMARISLVPSSQMYEACNLSNPFGSFLCGSGANFCQSMGNGKEATFVFYVKWLNWQQKRKKASEKPLKVRFKKLSWLHFIAEECR